jgi:hypothetical protein
MDAQHGAMATAVTREYAKIKANLPQVGVMQCLCWQHLPVIAYVLSPTAAAYPTAAIACQLLPLLRPEI